MIGELTIMADLINFETKSYRELLIIVAQAINSLNEKTNQLCSKVEEHGDLLNHNKIQLTSQENLIHEIIKENANVSLKMTETLKEINILLVKHTDQITDIYFIYDYKKIIPEFAFITKFFWLIIGTISTITASIIIWLVTHPIG